MVAILNVIKGKNKVIVSGLAGALSALIFLTAIHVTAKIAIIVSAAVVTYTLLSLIHKVTAKKDKSAKTPDMLEDKKKDIVVFGEKSEKTEAELKEIIRKKTEEEMKNGLPKHMDCKGNSLSKNADTEDSHYVSGATNIVMEPLPEHMDALGNPLPDPPGTLIKFEFDSTKKLSLADWLLQYGNVNNDVMKMLKQSFDPKGFNV